MLTTISQLFRPRIAWAWLGVLLLTLAACVVRPGDVRASGHSIYSYKAGNDCKGKSNILDAVSIEFLVQHVTVADFSVGIQNQSQALNEQNSSIPIWTYGNDFDDVKGQQGVYYRDGRRICSSFNATNATGGVARSRYHMRLHTGGPSTAYPGRAVIAGTPHYDKLCGFPVPKHEVWTFAGARTQVAKLYPSADFHQYIKYVGNTHSRKMSCLNKDVKNDGYALFILA